MFGCVGVPTIVKVRFRLLAITKNFDSDFNNFAMLSSVRYVVSLATDPAGRFVRRSSFLSSFPCIDYFHMQ